MLPKQRVASSTLVSRSRYDPGFGHRAWFGSNVGGRAVRGSRRARTEGHFGAAGRRAAGSQCLGVELEQLFRHGTISANEERFG